MQVFNPFWYDCYVQCKIRSSFILLPLEIQFFQQNLLNGSPVAYQRVGWSRDWLVPCAAAIKAEAQMFPQAPSRKMLVTWGRPKGKGRGGVCWLSCCWEGSKPSLRWVLNWKPDPLVAAFKVCSWIPFREIQGNGHFYLFPLCWAPGDSQLRTPSLFAMVRWGSGGTHKGSTLAIRARPSGDPCFR